MDNVCKLVHHNDLVIHARLRKEENVWTNFRTFVWFMNCTVPGYFAETRQTHLLYSTNQAAIQYGRLYAIELSIAYYWAHVTVT